MNNAATRYARWPDLVVWALRLILGAIFIYAGYIKIIDPHGFAKNIFQYQLLPDVLVNISALILPWLEVVAGACLIAVPPLRRGAAGWILLMLIVFTTAIIISLARGLDISCGCMSTDPAAAKIGWKKVFENTAMLAGISLLLWRDRR